MSLSDKFPELASTDNFQVWMDREDGEITIAFLARGFTVNLEWQELDELVGALTQARGKLQR
jgi:hypothetical protein